MVFFTHAARAVTWGILGYSIKYRGKCYTQLKRGRRVYRPLASYDDFFARASFFARALRHAASFFASG